MRYSVSATRTPVTPRKPFNFDEAVESLRESLDSLHVAYDDVVAAEGRVIEAEQCLEDCRCAYESIRKFGITEQNMIILNKDNALDQALGLESLQLNALESLTDASKKILQAKYIAGLEELAGDQKKGFWAKVKEFLAKIWNWIKEFFVSDAKIMSMLGNCKFEGKLKDSTVIIGWSYQDATKMFDYLKKIASVAGKQTITADTAEFEVPNRDRATIKSLGWDGPKASKICRGLLTEIANRKTFKARLEDDMAKVKEKMRKSNTDDGVTGMAQSGMDSVKVLKDRFKYVQRYSQIYRGLAFTVIAVAKAMSPEKAQKKSDQTKELEQKAAAGKSVIY